MYRAVLAALWLTLLSLAAAISLPEPVGSTIQARDADKFLLRIMPLGASITMGYKSTDGNGYREYIRQQLRHEGWQVDMVGSKRNGTMHNNVCHPLKKKKKKKKNKKSTASRRPHRLQSRSNLPSRQKNHPQTTKPNPLKVITPVHPPIPNLTTNTPSAGTNDAMQKHSIDSTGTRMNSLINKLFDQIDGTTIILSTLLPNKKEPALVKEINKQYRALAAFWRAKNGRVVLADMSQFIKEDQLVDGIHPDDYGYKEMASVWWAAIQVAVAEGMLQQASDTGVNGTISRVLEESLDDSTEDPALPAYSAPAQPTVNGGISGGLGMGWVGLQVGLGMLMLRSRDAIY
jgi:hypothetical protein